MNKLLLVLCMCIALPAAADWHTDMQPVGENYSSPTGTQLIDYQQHELERLHERIDRLEEENKKLIEQNILLTDALKKKPKTASIVLKRMTQAAGYAAGGGNAIHMVQPLPQVLIPANTLR